MGAVRWVVGAMVGLALAVPAAAEEQALVRGDVAAVKKMLQAAVSALGAPPEGYAQEREDFDLPTQVSTHSEKGRYWPVQGSVSLRYTGAGEQVAKSATENLGQEYEKKLAEAMAKGDYQAIAALSQQMQQQIGSAHLAAVEGRRHPISVSVQLNAHAGETIDPDAVLFEKPGVIALVLDPDPSRTRVGVFFDPVALKETETLSRVELNPAGERGVRAKTSAATAQVDFEGPGPEVKSWAERIDVKAVLAQLDPSAR